MLWELKKSRSRWNVLLYRDQKMRWKSLSAGGVEGQRLLCKQGKTLSTASTKRGISGPCSLLTLKIVPSLPSSQTDSSTGFLLNSLSHHPASKSHRSGNPSLCSKSSASSGGQQIPLFLQEKERGWGERRQSHSLPAP